METHSTVMSQHPVSRSGAAALKEGQIALAVELKVNTVSAP